MPDTTFSNEIALVEMDADQWNQYATDNPSYLASEVRSLDSLAEKTAMAAGYMEARQRRSTHQQALKHAESVSKKVRRALGYTMP